MAERVVRELGLEDEIELASLAKQFEEVYRPGSPEPVRLRRGSDALYLLQRVRDEAHRFAITFHRETAGQAHDHERPGRDPGPGSGPPAPGWSRSWAVSTPSGPPPWRSCWHGRGCPTTVGLAVYDGVRKTGGR